MDKLSDEMLASIDVTRPFPIDRIVSHDDHGP